METAGPGSDGQSQRRSPVCGSHLAIVTSCLVSLLVQYPTSGREDVILTKSIFLTSWELRKVTGANVYPGLSIGLETKLTEDGTAIEVATANIVV
jgi:hypothetical protein